MPSPFLIAFMADLKHTKCCREVRLLGDNPATHQAQRSRSPVRRRQKHSLSRWDESDIDLSHLNWTAANFQAPKRATPSANTTAASAARPRMPRRTYSFNFGVPDVPQKPKRSTDATDAPLSLASAMMMKAKSEGRLQTHPEPRFLICPSKNAVASPA